MNIKDRRQIYTFNNSKIIDSKQNVLLNMPRIKYK